MSTVTFQFKGKTALVTGAGQGMGRAISKALSSAGAVVFALDKIQQNLDSLVAECKDIRPVCVDLVDWHSTQSAVKSLGPIDLLVNNAGVTEVTPFTDVTVESFDWIMNVNVRAVFAVSQVFARGLLERGSSGAIVNISSQSSMRALTNHSVYCTSKAAVDQLTRSLAFELGPHQIRVNAVNPTVVMTAMGRQVWSDPAVADPLRERIPLRKFAELSDIVNTVLYLLSDAAAMINGVTLPVDGGYVTC